MNNVAARAYSEGACSQNGKIWVVRWCCMPKGLTKRFTRRLAWM